MSTNGQFLSDLTIAEDLHLVERNNLGIRADGSKAEGGEPIGRGDVVQFTGGQTTKNAA